MPDCPGPEADPDDQPIPYALTLLGHLAAAIDDIEAEMES